MFRRFFEKRKPKKPEGWHEPFGYTFEDYSEWKVIIGERFKGDLDAIAQPWSSVIGRVLANVENGPIPQNEKHYQISRLCTDKILLSRHDDEQLKSAANQYLEKVKNINFDISISDGDELNEGARRFKATLESLAAICHILSAKSAEIGLSFCELFDRTAKVLDAAPLETKKLLLDDETEDRKFTAHVKCLENLGYESAEIASRLCGGLLDDLSDQLHSLQNSTESDEHEGSSKVRAAFAETFGTVVASAPTNDIAVFDSHDQRYEKLSISSLEDTEKRAFFYGLSVLTHAAMSFDGEFDPLEMDQIKHTFVSILEAEEDEDTAKILGAELVQVMEMFDESSKGETIELDEVKLQTAASLGADFISFMFQSAIDVILADGKLHFEEINGISQFAEIFGYNKERLAEMMISKATTAGPDPDEILFP